VKALDVIWIQDDTIRPPGPKMVVCIEPRLGLFFRINSEGKWQIPVRIERSTHPFLKRDSSIECGEPLELDDYVIDQALHARGVVGEILPQLAPQIWAAVLTAKSISTRDKDAIRLALRIPSARPSDG